MTWETCKKRMEIARTNEEREFWKARMERKMARKGIILTNEDSAKKKGK